MYHMYHRISESFLLLYCFHLYFCLLSTTVDAQMDDVGLDFVKNSISAIEKRGKFKTYHYLTYNQITFSSFKFLREVSQGRGCNVTIWTQGGGLAPLLKHKPQTMWFVL